MAPRTLADERMIEVMFILIELYEVKSQAKFCQRIGAEKYIITKIRKGGMSFTIAQIENTISEFGINANFIFGVEKNVFIGVKNTANMNRIIRNIRGMVEIVMPHSN